LALYCPKVVERSSIEETEKKKRINKKAWLAVGSSWGCRGDKQQSHVSLSAQRTEKSRSMRVNPLRVCFSVVYISFSNGLCCFHAKEHI